MHCLYYVQKSVKSVITETCRKILFCFTTPLAYSIVSQREQWRISSICFLFLKWMWFRLFEWLFTIFALSRWCILIMSFFQLPFCASMNVSYVLHCLINLFWDIHQPKLSAYHAIIGYAIRYRFMNRISHTSQVQYRVTVSLTFYLETLHLLEYTLQNKMLFV